MKQVRFFLSWVLLLFFLGSCQQGKKAGSRQGTRAVAVHFKPGIVYDTVRCVKHPGESYALALPSQYIAGKRFPVLFLFDAQARGSLPVKRYQPLADSFGIILVASNNSKNGLTAPERNRIIYHFMEDVEKRFSLDARRIYTGGFSGGARIAAGIGLTNTGVAGTIGCAAGFPQLRQVANKQLAYAGIVGNTDFNYIEIEQLARQLDAAGWRHCLLVFNGHHQWPPLKTMKMAFYFLQTDAMRRHLIPVDSQILQGLKSIFDKERMKARRENNLLLQWQTDKTAIAFLEKLTDVSVYQKEEAVLQKNPLWQKQQRRQAALLKEELQRQQQLARALQTEPAAWWKKTLQELAQEKKAARLPAKKQMIQRLFNYLSLVGYLYAEGSLKNRQWEEARKYLMIYRFVDPGNPEVYFLQARLFAMTGKPPDKILAALQTAADKGFYDVKTLNADPLFVGLYNNSRFRKIRQQIAKNPLKEM